MRMAELCTSDSKALMPQSLEAACNQLQVAVPIDPLAEAPKMPIIYESHPETGNYILRHTPNRKPYEEDIPREFHGMWIPGK